ncbi:MAG: hypothetical protein LC624_08985 [Halobacteriales archaeon]|nr:hypothetical protein [Halobacteriales archaeon]
MAPLDASTGSGEARIVSPSLRRGVRLELLVAPVSFLLPFAAGLLFIAVGARHALPAYVALGLLLIGANLVFSVMMVRNAVRFLRGTKPA